MFLVRNNKCRFSRHRRRRRAVGHSPARFEVTPRHTFFPSALRCLFLSGLGFRFRV
jgi:hypothetical protein